MSTANKLFQAASGGAGESVYVEDVFSTNLWAGDGSSETITNGIDFSGEGGMVWFARRTTTDLHTIIDTERGGNTAVFSTSTSANYTNSNMITSFNSNGFTVGSYLGVNENNEDLVGWSFRKQAGFFDVVTYTGNGSNRTISHNLGSVPGVMIVKRTSDTEGWQVYHRDLAATEYLELNSTNAKSSSNGTLRWNSTRPTATEFSLGTHDSVNASGSTYVAYLFAHDDQSFGDDSDEAIIKCGSYTGNGNVVGPLIDLGFEPQFIMIKAASRTGHWFMLDVMRGIMTGSSDSSPGSNQYLLANSSGAEGTTTSINVNSTGFQPRTTDDSVNENSATYTYIAIRRPMKTPEAGTEVFSPITSTGTGSARTLSGTFPTDLTFMHQREATDDGRTFAWDRLRGKSSMLQLTNTSAEAGITGVGFDVQNGLDLTDSGFSNYNTAPYITYLFKRAPGFFDVVAYNGGGTAGDTQSHNLGVVPEMMIVKARSKIEDWAVYHAGIPNPEENYLYLSGSFALNPNANTIKYWNHTAPTASEFTLGIESRVNGSGHTYIAYLFATLDGVSKVGSYTGTGSNLNVDCGFSAGARFILIKRTDATGDWYIWDSARGIVAGNDPYFRPNVSGAEVTNTDYIDPLSSGFTVTSAASSTINVSSGTYIFLAIA